MELVMVSGLQITASSVIQLCPGEMQSYLSPDTPNPPGYPNRYMG